MKHDPGLFTVCLWLSLQIPALRSNWEDPASGFFSRVEASVSPPAERSGRALWAGIRWEAENWALKLCLNNVWIFFSVCRHHQHPHPVHLRRHGDPSHRDQVGLQGPERWLLHQPVSKPESYLEGKNKRMSPWYPALVNILMSIQKGIRAISLLS